MMDLAEMARTRERLGRAVLDLGEARAQQLFGERLTAAAAQAFELAWGKQSLSSEELKAIAETEMDQIDAQWEALRPALGG